MQLTIPGKSVCKSEKQSVQQRTQYTVKYKPYLAKSDVDIIRIYKGAHTTYSSHEKAVTNPFWIPLGSIPNKSKGFYLV